MGRTIPSFRIAAVLEEKTWKQYRNFLNKKDKKAFDNMFSIAKLYNSSCSYSTAIPIRIYPIMMSIVFHHYKTATKNNMLSTVPNDHNGDNNYDSIILRKEIDNGKPTLTY